jgi:hypothetical protein
MTLHFETVGEAAERILPNTTYDTALPQDWVDDVKRVTGTYPAGMFVWCYGQTGARGIAQHPHPLTDEAVLLLMRYERER